MAEKPGTTEESSEIAPPRLIAWEVTRHCLLNCKHCRAASRHAPDPGELSTDECFGLLENIASFARPVIILTGGEPMLRSDVYDIARHACGLGLRVVMAPCGMLLNEETVAKIKQSGIALISLSIDGATAQTHDAFRGFAGAFDACLNGIEAAKRGGLDFQINTTISKHNLAELPAIFELAVGLGASVFNPFLLVPTGRGRELAHQELSAEGYERALRWLAEREADSPIPIRVTCAPHYQRILRQLGWAAEDGRGPRGCLGGKTFAFISHRGKVQICGFLDVECGDLRREGLDFGVIWRNSEVLRQVRDVDSYHGRCGYCEYRKVCGGCRARAYATTGDYLGEEPYCIHQPARPARAGQGEAEREPDERERRILSRIQADFPIVEGPFDALAGELGLGAHDLIAAIALLKADGFVRRLGAVFDSRRLGYTSTLVAARVPADRLDEVVALVNALPGVTHHYGRDHEFNIWFTLTARSEDELERTLEDLRERTAMADLHSLPALTTYKIRVHFDMVGGASSVKAPEPPAETPIGLDEDRKALVRLLQGDLPLVSEPFAELAGRLGRPVGELLAEIADLLDRGAIRRFGAVVNHRRLGYRANGMAVFRVPAGQVDGVGRALAAFGRVSHCYRRAQAPGWPYNLFAMVHGRRHEEVRRFVQGVAARHGLEDYDILFSTAEYKKTSMRYFEES